MRFLKSSFLFFYLFSLTYSLILESSPTFNPLVFNDTLVIGTSTKVYIYNITSDTYSTIKIGTHDGCSVDGVAVLASDENLILLSPNGSVVTNLPLGAIACGNNVIYSLAGNSLRVYYSNGTILRETDLPQPCDRIYLSDGERFLLCNGGSVVKLGVSNQPIGSIDLECENVYFSDGYVLCYHDYVLDIYSSELDKVGSLYTNGRVMDVLTEDDVLYLLTSDDTLRAIRDGEVIWRTSVPGGVSLSRLDGNLLVGSRDNRIYLISNTGEVLFEYRTDSWPDRIVSSDTNIILITHEHEVIILPRDLLCYFETPEPYSIVGEGMLLVSGEVYSPTGRLPTFYVIGDNRSKFIPDVAVHGERYTFTYPLSLEGYPEGKVWIICEYANRSLDDTVVVKSNKVLSRMDVEYSPKKVREGDTIYITARDDTYNLSLPITVYVDDEVYGPSENVSVRLSRAGDVELNVSSPGYRSVLIHVHVDPSINLNEYLMYILIFVVVLLLLNKLYTSRRRRSYESI